MKEKTDVDHESKFTMSQEIVWLLVLIVWLLLTNITYCCLEQSLVALKA